MQIKSPIPFTRSRLKCSAKKTRTSKTYQSRFNLFQTESKMLSSAKTGLQQLSSFGPNFNLIRSHKTTVLSRFRCGRLTFKAQQGHTHKSVKSTCLWKCSSTTWSPPKFTRWSHLPRCTARTTFSTKLLRSCCPKSTLSWTRRLAWEHFLQQQRCKATTAKQY